jgi:hypothetical protein
MNYKIEGNLLLTGHGKRFDTIYERHYFQTLKSYYEKPFFKPKRYIAQNINNLSEKTTIYVTNNPDELIRFMKDLKEWLNEKPSEIFQEQYPKATLEFHLPENKSEFTLAVKGSDYWCVLWDLVQEIKSILKHDDLTDKEYEAIERIRNTLFELLESYNINLDEID